MDLSEIRELVDKGGLLRVKVPSGQENGAAELVAEMQRWIKSADAVNGNPAAQALYPAIKFLRNEIEERISGLSKPPDRPED